jgi:two-component system cell cycle response regulator
MSAHILIIEDNPTNLELMSYLLKAAGYRVTTAADGEQGVALALQELPDLIVCDIQMPKLDGYGVARELKRHPVMGWRPLVAVTALAMVGDRDRILAAGFDGYVSKPIDPEAFARLVGGYLKSSPRSAAAPPVPPRVGDKQPARSVHILVVDDVEANRELIRCTLEPFGYVVCCVTSIAEAIASAAVQMPDLLMTDVHLQGESGFELIRKLKSDARLRSVPVVVLTSTLWADKDRRQALELGVVEFIARPIETRALHRRVTACLAARPAAGAGA